MINYFKQNSGRGREVLQLALPVLAEQVFITLMGVVNAMMAGHIGKEAAAAIGMIDTLNNIFISAFSSLAVGATVVVAHYTGQSNHRFAGEASKQALYAGLTVSSLIAVAVGAFRQPLMGILFGSAENSVLRLAFEYLAISLFTYPLIALTAISCGVLRGAGDTRTPAQVVIIMNVVNVIAGYILIFGLTPLGFDGFGVSGAALAIGIARLSGVVLLLYVLVRGTLNLKLQKVFKFKPNLEMLAAIFKIGIPASLESFLFNSGKLITQTFIVASGTVAIVTNYVGMSLHSLMMTPGLAFSLAATALVGQNMGRGDSQEAEKSLMYLDKLTVCCLMAVNIIFLPFYSFFCSLYTSNAEIIKQTTLLLQVTIIFVPFWPMAFLWPAGLKGAGDVRYTLIVSAISMWVFRITLGYVLCIYFKLGVLGIWFGMYTDWIIRGIAFLVRLKRGKWKNNIVVKK
ncbi:MAG: MATE family efflux transporter [Bacteroidota bacterium]